MRFLGREQELSALEREYKRDGGFVVVYGRRRVGKTTLIKEFIKGKNALYFLANEETLAYNGMQFSVPKNLYIIGMMNTADRSLAMIDYALRRRFSFFDVEPGFDSQGFIEYQNSLKNDTLNALIAAVKELNNEITSDKSLGKGFCIGHSYFCGREDCTEEWLRDVVNYDILPMLREYWFDETNKLQTWENRLQGVFQS
jgi:5-methylcytosine-specific restriction protein B